MGRCGNLGMRSNSTSVGACTKPNKRVSPVGGGVFRATGKPNPTLTLDENYCRAGLPAQIGPIDTFTGPALPLSETQ